MKLTLKEAKDRFVQFGECNHQDDFEAEFSPYGCPNIVLTTCTICSEIKKKIYINLAN